MIADAVAEQPEPRSPVDLLKPDTLIRGATVGDDNSSQAEAAIQEIVDGGLRQGINPSALVKEARDLLWLTGEEAEKVEEYRRQLTSDRRKRKQDRIERMVAKYAKRLLTERARSIVVTKTFRAQSEAHQERLARMVADGTLKTEDWEVEWVTAHDNRTCSTCLPLHGARSDLMEPFNTSVGPLLHPPLHPCCRCIVRIVLRGFRAGQPPTKARDAILAKLGTGAKR